MNRISLILSRLFELSPIARPPVGIELGSQTTRVVQAGKLLWVEPTVYLKNLKNQEIISLGNQAQKYFAVNPETTQLISPIVAGQAVANQALVEYLSALFGQLNLTSQLFAGKPIIYLSWQNNLSPAQKLAYERSLSQAGAGAVKFIDAFALAWINLVKQKLVSGQALLLNVGAQTTTLGLVQNGQIVCDYFVPQGIELVKKQIQATIREKYSLSISLSTAEKVLTELVQVPNETGEQKALVIRGKCIETGLPDTQKISSEELKNVVAGYLQLLLESWQLLLEKLPSSIQREIGRAHV